ncbi:hypothetical protein KIPB_014634, partial [Kipferlia bialata]|eukprot:g14634.t1
MPENSTPFTATVKCTSGCLEFHAALRTGDLTLLGLAVLNAPMQTWEVPMPLKDGPVLPPSEHMGEMASDGSFYCAVL